MKYTPVPLCSYVNLWDPYCANAIQKETEYLKQLEPERLLHSFYVQAGLTPSAPAYEGWEQTQIKGHTLGHYLTALCQAQQTLGIPWVFHRIDSILQGLLKCQREDGYLFASEENLFDALEQDKPAWVPWYTMHKLLDSLCCAARTPGHESTALWIARRLGDWVADRVLSWDEDTQKRVLAVEYGGMNDAMYQLYDLTKDPRHRDAAHRFDETWLFAPLAEGKDVLNGRHANTTIPKLLGAVRRYLVLGEREEDQLYLQAALSFWEMVVHHHSYVTGGNSEWEHFGPADVLDGERTGCNCETCNSYNMLKLSQLLYSITGERKYMDFYQWTYYNAILASQNPDTGMTTYFQPMGTGYFKAFSTPFDSFWCCTGTGMESFTKLGEGTCYFTGPENKDLVLWRYQSSHIEGADYQLHIYADLPRSGEVEVRVHQAPEEGFTLYLAVPDWCAGTPTLEKNGQAMNLAPGQNGLLAVPVKQRDSLRLTLSLQVRAHFLPDKKEAVAFSYGPAVLSADLGRQDMKCGEVGVKVTVATREVPVRDYILVDNRERWLEHLSQNLVQEQGKLAFTLKNMRQQDTLEFVPYFSQHGCRGGIYFYLLEPDSPALTQHLISSKMQRREYRCEVDSLPIGNDQYELLHQVAGEHTRAGSDYFENFRAAEEQGWFAYTMKLSQKPCFLRFLVLAKEGIQDLSVTVNGMPLALQLLPREEGEEFDTCCCPLPQSLLGENAQAVFRFAPKGGNPCRIFGRLAVSEYYDTDPHPQQILIRGGYLTPAFTPEGKEYTLHPTAGQEGGLRVVPHLPTGLCYLQNFLLEDEEMRPMKWVPGDRWEITCLAEDQRTAKRICLTVAKPE